MPPGWRNVVAFRFVDRAADPYVTEGGERNGVSWTVRPAGERPADPRGLPRARERHRAGGQTFSVTRSSVATGAGEAGAGASGATFSSASIVFVKPNQYVATKPPT